MDDLISREAALDALSNMMDTDGFRDGWAVSRANVDCMLRYLPSAEPDTRLEKIAELTEGTIDHFDFDDAMDLLYQIKGVIGNG